MPRIFDNIELELLPALRATLDLAGRADFCVGYFNLRGWKTIDDLIEQWPGGLGKQCRLLVGMQRPPQEELRAAFSFTRDGEQLDNQSVVRLKKRLAEDFRDQLSYGVPTNVDETGLRRLAAQLKAGKLVVKLFLRHPLHAKLYLLFRADPINPIIGYLGSSNLTLSGLSHQGELNLDVLDNDAANKLVGWFEDRWNDHWCVDITAELIQVIDESWAREVAPPPYQIYVKMAYHLAQEARAGLSEFRIPPEFGQRLFDYQVAAVKIAAHHLNKRGGVLIGDVVGLGKTLMATALAKIFQDDQFTETLIICPKNLVKMWEEYVAEYRLLAKVLSVTMAARELPDLRRYRIVLIDESHKFPPGDRTTLSDIRSQLKTDIEAVEIFGKKAFEVWINEEAPPKAANSDSWEVCLKEVADCDILLVISNGNAGWAKTPGEIGICHAELMTGLSLSPGKVWYISLGNSATGDKEQLARNERFQQYTKTQSLFRGAEVTTIPELKARVHESLHEAIIALTQRGVRESSRGKFHSGEALDWSRLDFAGRQAEMIRVIRDALKSRPKAIDIDPAVSVPISAVPVLFVPTAIPAALTIASAREMVGQPFLRDHETYADLSATKATGPVHMIACHKTVTEAQALRLLGFPDATVVAAPFGVYVADDIQKIQMVLIANCRDETTTRHAVQRVFEWLEQTGEGARLALRAASRTKIIKTIAGERVLQAANLPKSRVKLPPKQKKRSTI